MGVSTDAILCFGLLIEEDSENHERLQKLQEGWRDEKYKELCDAEKKYGVKLVVHCSGDYPLYIIANDDVAEASRGYAKAIGPLPKKDITGVIDFCKAFDIPMEGTWGTWLVSYWG